MTPGFYSKAQVSDLTTLSLRTIYRLMQKGTFPTPVRVTEGRIAWRRSDVDTWLNERAGAVAA